MTGVSSPVLVALVGLIAALLGGVIQAITARQFEHARFERQTKWELYSQYFLVLGELTFTEHGTERHRNALSLMAQLRGKIGVVGSPEVISAVGAVFRYPDLLSVEAQAAMANALDAMRRDVGGRKWKIERQAFVQLMFGSRDSE